MEKSTVACGKVFSYCETVVPAVSNIGGECVADRASTKRRSETRVGRGGSSGKQPLETRTPGPKDMIREVWREGGWQLTQGVSAAY